jgi:hypothetical protein
MDRHFPGAEDTPDEESPKEKSATKPGAFALAPCDLISGIPDASSWFTELATIRCAVRCATRRAAKCFGISIFLMRPTTPPVVLLPASTVLVWSEAWKAEGEYCKALTTVSSMREKTGFVPTVTSDARELNSTHEQEHNNNQQNQPQFSAGK